MVFSIGSHKSSLCCQVTTGVSQGSILLPLLFIIYINVLAKLLLLSSATPVLYVNDILLSQEFSSPTSMSTVQSIINLTTSWISSHHFAVPYSHNKWKEMLLHQRWNERCLLKTSILWLQLYIHQTKRCGYNQTKGKNRIHRNIEIQWELGIDS